MAAIQSTQGEQVKSKRPAQSTEAARAEKAAAEKAARKRAKANKLREVTGYDLFYQLIYMSAIAAAGIERRKIFELASELPRKTAAYFRRIHLLSQKLGYDYSDSTQIVGEKVKSEVMKSLLLRFADALSAGQPESAFLAEEAVIQTELYEKEYERDLESLKKWTDGYGALIISSTLIIIVNLISVLIYPIDSSMIGVLVLVSLASSSGGAWILYRTGPAEKRAIYKENGPPLQRNARKYGKMGAAGVLFIAIPAGLLGLPIGWTMILAGLCLMPAGVYSHFAGVEVTRKDGEIGPFLRSLGTFSTATGTTMVESMSRIDMSPYPNLRADLRRLQARMKASILPALCWQKFSEETGSRLIIETTTIYNDAIGLGSSADTVGLFSAKYAAMTTTLRSRRVVVSSTFTMLTIVMHAVLTALMIVILEVIENFTAVIEESMAAATAAVEASAVPLPMFGSPELGFLQMATVGMVIAMAVINALAIVVTDGDHMIKTNLYLGVLFITSGICFIILPPMVANMVAI